MNFASQARAGSDTDESLRRLEADIVAGDLALQRQTEALLSVAANRAERTAVWGAAIVAGAGLLFMVDRWIGRRGRSPRRRASDVRGSRDRRRR